METWNESFLGKWAQFNKCLAYVVKSIGKTFRAYIYLLLLPIVLVSVIYIFTYHQSVKYSYAVSIAGLVLLPIMFNVFLVSYVICDWRESVFIKQLSNFRISKFQFIGSLLLAIFIFTFISVWIVIAYLFLIDSFEKTSVMMIWIDGMNSFLKWFGLVIAIVLSIISFYFLGLLISGFLKNFYIVQSLNVLLIIVSLVFGDFFVDFDFSTQSAVIIIGYFVPQNYLTWINYIFYTDSELSSNNLFLIVSSVDGALTFTNIYQPLFGSVVFCAALSVGSYVSFSKGIKK